MSARHKVLKLVRLVHLYFGVFITPALLFFAFTGALQTFSLHETTRGSDYKPPRWAVVLGQLHKKQTTIVPVRRPQPPQQAAAAQQPQPASSAPPSAPEKKPTLFPMKIFFLIVAIGLFISSITGLYMSYAFIRNKLAVTATLAAGVLIPILLLFV